MATNPLYILKHPHSGEGEDIPFTAPHRKKNRGSPFGLLSLFLLLHFSFFL
ncbi:hypothetical protein RchiOBHm_Chr1g0353651 [Rosa chinensis]|uniref:Uncharacterized protein n=1 Tax=Rosa chinensis TaxID=74649 RepID=A0A2P6SGX9_ROSCH|nr:hypothetical protein RchiOBHm_Chr1g0353651 [Rosa chinensis]